MDVDFEELAMFLEALESTDFSHFVYEKGDVRIEVRRGAVPSETSVLASRPAVTPGEATSNPGATPAAASGTSAKSVAAAPPAAAGTAPEFAEGDVQITAPLLGTVYFAPKPGEAPFVEVGGHVTAGSPVCIVEVMKLMNSVEAPVDGTIVARHVSDGDLVEFGHVIFTIRPDNR